MDDQVEFDTGNAKFGCGHTREGKMKSLIDLTGQSSGVVVSETYAQVANWDTTDWDYLHAQVKDLDGKDCEPTTIDNVAEYLEGLEIEIYNDNDDDLDVPGKLWTLPDGTEIITIDGWN